MSRLELYCRQPVVAPRYAFGPDVDPRRARAIASLATHWVNGTTLRFCFLAGEGLEPERELVRAALWGWQGTPIGLAFREVTDPAEAELRIGFDYADGSWSYVGRDNLSIPVERRTMNFGWPLEEGARTAYHEIGHAIGLQHEHQNPNAGIAWDEHRVHQYFGGSPNFWDRETTHHNILRKFPQEALRGTAWDHLSIMHYGFPGGLILRPEAFAAGIPTPRRLSEHDRAFIAALYPTENGAGAPPPVEPLSPGRFITAPAVPGAQLDLALVVPRSGTFTVATAGPADCLMVLFEEIGGEPRYMAGDDDAGTADNARIRRKFYAGHRYVVRVRVLFAPPGSEVGVMLW
jgi:hypothetical protein